MLPSLASKGKLLRDRRHRHHDDHNLEVKAYRGRHSSMEETSITRVRGPMKVCWSKSCVVSIRATPKTLAAVMLNLRTLSQYFAIFLVNYNNTDHKCYDVATHWMCQREGGSTKWQTAYNIEEVKTKCQSLGELAEVNFNEFFSMWRVDAEGGPEKRGKVFLQATHLKFVLLHKSGEFETGEKVVLDVGGLIIPVLEKCNTIEVDVQNGSESDGYDEGR